MAEEVTYREVAAARRKTQMVLLKQIEENTEVSAIVRDLAEAFALLEGTLTSQPVTVKKD